MPQALKERYDDIQLLGEGGMGTVYRARDRRLDRVVALKLLRRADPRLARRLLLEARAQARVQHDRICRVYEAGEADGEPYIAMQYIAGEPLDRSRARMTLEQKVKVIREIAAALHEAHRIGLVHRDIKPGNILVKTTEDGALTPYVVDFGLAREVASEGHTVTGAVLGTPAYMAPEQARGEIRALDRRTDVYSLGATLYYLVAGRTPFVADHPLKVLTMVAYEEPPGLRAAAKEAPEDIETIVMKCLERDPGRRYESARALGEDLQRFLDGEPIQARRAALGYVLWKKAKKHRWAATLGSVVVLSTAALLGAWGKARRDAAQQATIARELGEDVKEMELFLRSAYGLPLHDVERERDIVRARLAGIERRMAEAGSLGEGPGHYALGRGYLALQEPEKAREHLEKAQVAGYASAELEYALGQALGELYRRALADTKRIHNAEERAAKVREIEARLREPALAHLRAALGATIESSAYAEGLIAFYGDKHEEALAKARAAFEKAPWLYEAKKLEGDAQFALGSRYRHDAAFDWDRMMAHFGPAADAYRAAGDIARSDPEVHRAECELWTQSMWSAGQRGQSQQASFDRAREVCARAVAASSRDGRSRVQRAFAHARFIAGEQIFATSGREPRRALEEAIELASEAVRASPEDSLARWVLASACKAEVAYLTVSGQDADAALRRAVDAYEAVLRVEPRFLTALYELASIYSWMIFSEAWRGADGKAALESGLQLVERALAVDATFAYAWSSKSSLHVFRAQQIARHGQSPQEQVQQAILAAEESLRRSPGLLNGHYYSVWARCILALHEIQAGRDPRPLLQEAAQSAERIAQSAADAAPYHEMPGLLRYTEAVYLLREGKDPGPALREARASFQRAVDRVPWALDYRWDLARVEILSLRWALQQREAHPAMFEAAFAPLRPLLSDERADPTIYQALAEIHALRAAWLHGGGRSPAADLAKGLAMADKALSRNPRMATAFAARGSLLLVQARAARARAARVEAARRAREAFDAAFRENPLLEREHGPALREVAALL